MDTVDGSWPESCFPLASMSVARWTERDSVSEVGDAVAHHDDGLVLVDFI